MNARALLLAALLCGCPSRDGEGLATTTPDQALDYNQFVCGVQPILARRCSYLACHGNPDHALRVYSPGKLRLLDTGVRNERDAPLTADEVRLNFESAAGMVLSATPLARLAGDVNTVPLLGKPLARRAGGAEHHGVGVFPVSPAGTVADDPEWQTLVAWVAGARQPNPVSAACAQLFDNLGLPPRAP